MTKQNEETIDILKTVICKHYDLEVIESNRYLNLVQKINPYELQGITLKTYKNAELMNINGLGTGQVHFLTEKGEYLLLPWCYIISMIPSKEGDQK